MDNFTIHLAPLPRRHPHPLQVGSIGYLARKRAWMRSTFRTCNYSFVLRGEGEFRTPEGVWPVRAPCVITQWPDAHLEYGPDGAWEELYIVYPAGAIPALTAEGFFGPGRRTWTIHDPGPTRRVLAELRERLSEAEGPISADRVDRLCGMLLLESRIAAAHAPADENEQALFAIRGYLDEHFAESIDFDELALENGFSPSHFRRLWGARFGAPPGRCVMELRIRQARRMLVETARPVGEIGAAVGFADPLYFSRRFRAEVGMSPTGYRAGHETPLSFAEAE